MVGPSPLALLSPLHLFTPFIFHLSFAFLLVRTRTRTVPGTVVLYGSATVCIVCTVVCPYQRPGTYSTVYTVFIIIYGNNIVVIYIPGTVYYILIFYNTG
jgi:hypothetical protein